MAEPSVLLQGVGSNRDSKGDKLTVAVVTSTSTTVSEWMMARNFVVNGCQVETASVWSLS